MIHFIFALCCGGLFIIGKIFGLDYYTSSVLICIYLLPIICILCALYTLCKSLVKRSWKYFTINSILLVLYLIFTFVVFKEFLAYSIQLQFVACMGMLYTLADVFHTSYEVINIVIYCIIFPAIILIHFIQNRVLSRK